MRKIDIVRLLKLVFVVGIILCINFGLPTSQANSLLIASNPSSRVFLDGKISGLDVSSSNCNDPKQQPMVGMVPRLSKAKTITEPNPLVSSYTINSLRRCPPNDPNNPGCSQSFLWKPLENNMAYFRDVIVSTTAVISNPTDKEVFAVVYTRPDGSTFGGGTATFYATNAPNLPGRTNCYVFSDGSALCDVNVSLINDFFFISRCKQPGQWTSTLLKGTVGSPLQTVTSANFTLEPEIGTPPLPPFTQVLFNPNGTPAQYGNFCKDPATPNVYFECNPNDTTHPVQDPVSFSLLGCTITAMATALNHYDIPATPLDLNDFLTQNNGFNYQNGEIRYQLLPVYAVLKGKPNRITDVLRVEASEDISSSLCNYGATLCRVHNNTHMVTAYGLDIDFLGVATPKVIDPNGGNLRLLTKAYYTGIDYFLRILGAEYSFTRRSISFQFYSPVEVFVTDPLGRRKGLDPRTNTRYNEIPNSFYGRAGTIGPEVGPDYHPPLVLEVNGPASGEYTLTVVGTGNGTYRSTFDGYDDNLNVSTTHIPSIATAPGVVHTYKINFTGTVGSQLEVAGNFDGGGQRPRDVNKFLSYINPTDTSTVLPTGTTSYPLTIIYNKAVVTNSFQATLDGADVSSLFNPKPGSLETVNVPLQSGKHTLILSIEGNLSNRTAKDTDRLILDVQ